MIIKRSSLPFPVTEALTSLLFEVMKKQKIRAESLEAITFNFKDPDYSAERGGFHPVEIRLIFHGKEASLEYITDFSYAGVGHCAELVKDLDFDFSTGDCQSSSMGTMAISAEEKTALYQLWESNFISYYHIGVFDVTVSIES